MLKDNGKNYAFWRVQGTFNTRVMNRYLEHDYHIKDSYKSNPDIDLSKTKDNIYIVKRINYKKYYDEQISPLKLQHEEEQKIKRKNRRKTFNQYLNSGNSSILETHVFEATKDYFKNSDKEEIERWANTCMDFLYKELNYKPKLVISSVVHMDENTPHLHVTYLPLVYKYDKKKKKECYTLSKQDSIKGKTHLSQLQSIHQQYMLDNGFNLERGTIESHDKNLSTAEFKNKQIELQKAKEKTKVIDSKTIKVDKILDNLKPVPLSKNNLIISNEDKEQIKGLLESVKQSSFDIQKLSNFTDTLKDIENEVTDYRTQIKGLKAQVKNRDKTIQFLNDDIDNAKSIIESKTDQIYELEQENNKLYNALNYWKDKFKSLIKFLHRKLNHWIDKEDVYEKVVEDLYNEDIIDYEEYNDVISKEKDDFES